MSSADLTNTKFFSPTSIQDLGNESCVWNSVLQTLNNELDPQIYGAYLEELAFTPSPNSQHCFTVSAPSKLISDRIESEFKGRIETIICEKLSIPKVDIKFIVDKDLSAKRRNLSTFVVTRVRPQNPIIEKSNYDPSFQSHLNKRYDFDNFVVGNSNQFCHAAARRVAENPGQSYNPLFIYGGVGLGKTHLLHAIGNHVLSVKPHTKILYLSAESFINELILALRNAKMEDFKAKFRSVEVLLIDDIQFISGKERTQEEFFHTFNALYNAKHQIVVTSDKTPQDIEGLEDRLRTRFSWGLTADLQAPDYETRIAILNKKAFDEDFELPCEVANIIAENISSNVRELEGALTRVHALSSLQSLPITPELAESALRLLIQPKTVNITIENIAKEVSLKFNVKVVELKSKKRTRNLSFPRHIAMYLCRKHTTSSYPEIGAYFGGRDHSSVIHAAHVVSEKIKSDPELVKIVVGIEKRLMS